MILFSQRLMEGHWYQPEFLGSNWKLLHDALQTHRARLLHDVLPPYDICAA